MAEIDCQAVRVPDYVVFRQFPAETVVLNLQTGLYHGLNPTAGRMLEVLIELPTVGEAAARLVAEFDVPEATVLADLAGLIAQLQERSLLILEDAQAGAPPAG